MRDLPPLDRIGFGWKSHCAVWRWAAVIFRHYKLVERRGQKLGTWGTRWCAVKCLLHLAPWFWVFGFLVNFLAVLALQDTSLAYAVSVGLRIGLVSLLFGLGAGLFYGLIFGLVGGLGGGLVFGLSLGVGLGGVVGLVVVCLSFGLVVGVVLGLVGGVVGGVGVGVGVVGLARGRGLGLVVGVGVGVGWYAGMFRLHSLASHLWRSRAQDGKFLDDRWRRHPVILVRRTLTPFWKLDEFLTAVWETEPPSGRRLIRRLLAENVMHRPAARRALAVVTARTAARLDDLSRLPQVLRDLPEGDRGWLARAVPLREKADAVARCQQQAHGAGSAVARKLALMEAQEAVAAFRAFVSGCEPPLVAEFLKAADAWNLNLQRQIEAQPREVPQVFTAELDLRPGMEAFVRRDALLGELERLLLQPSGGGGLLLYARRRMGKSTLLKNLQRLLPRELSVAYLSLQSAEANTSAVHLARRLGEIIRASCPVLAPLEPPTDPASLAAFLRHADAALETAGHRLLIGLDEYEILDEKIGQGAMTEDVLALVRDAIQQHRRIRWLVSGVHHFSDLTRARWSSYLTAFQVVEMHPFSPEETRQLLTDPLRHAAVFSGRTPPGARFFRDFWHEGAVERIHHESQGWPALAQGIAREVVRLCQAAQALRSTPEILDQALHAVLETMHGTLMELLLQGVPAPAPGEPEPEARATERAAGAWLLASLRSADAAPAPADDRLRRLLTRHELIADPAAPHWRLRVPLMQRWLRERG